MLRDAHVSSDVLTEIPFADPVAMSLFDDRPRGAETLGSFANSPHQNLGFLPIHPAVIMKAYTVIRTITGMLGSSSSPAMKNIYQQIPQSMIRVTGGNGKWTDTLTGETMNDLATEVRKSAMLASALGVYVNHDNWYFDDTTGEHLSPDVVRQRWDKLFGTSSFQDAYSRYPELFRTYGSDPSHDPVISDAAKVENAGPLHPSDRSGAGILDDAAGQVGTSNGGNPPVHVGTTPTQANIFGNISPTVLLVVLGLGAFMFMRKRAR